MATLQADSKRHFGSLCFCEQKLLGAVEIGRDVSTASGEDLNSSSR